jgi:hypothetical protein
MPEKPTWPIKYLIHTPVSIPAFHLIFNLHKSTPIPLFPIPKMSTKGTVLISGINGYIASRTAETFLEAGYSVRGTVRSLSSAKGLQDVLKDYVEAGKLSVVEVPDITKASAFDEAVKGNSPFPSSKLPPTELTRCCTRCPCNSPHGFASLALLH